MASFNKVMLLGNLTRDPQLKYLPSQTAVVEFGIATNRKWRTQTGEEREEACFVDCSAFGKAAEIINQYCQKGKQLFVEGRLKLDQWEDKQGGGKRSKLTVVVDNFVLLGGGRGGPEGGVPSGEGGQVAPRSAPRPPQRSGAPAPSAPPVEQPFPEEPQFKEDDIPF